MIKDEKMPLNITQDYLILIVSEGKEILKMVKNILQIENARIIFRNFSGKESQYNRAGDRNFAVIIENDEMAQKLIDDGWNVRILEPKNDGDEVSHYLPVKVSFSNIPPKIWVVKGNKKTRLTEETIEELDYAQITNVDIAIRPYNWEVNNKTGVKAYVKTMYVTVEEDEFAYKYSDDDTVEDEDTPF